MIELHLVLHTTRYQTRAVVSAFQTLARWARAEPGCLSAQLFVAVDESRSLCYVETWESEEALRRMIRSSHFSQLATLMELGAEAPECEFRLITETRGLEFPMMVRNHLDNAGDNKTLRESVDSP